MSFRTDENDRRAPATGIVGTILGGTALGAALLTGGRGYGYGYGNPGIGLLGHPPVGCAPGINALNSEVILGDKFRSERTISEKDAQINKLEAEKFTLLTEARLSEKYDAKLAQIRAELQAQISKNASDICALDKDIAVTVTRIGDNQRLYAETFEGYKREADYKFVHATQICHQPQYAVVEPPRFVDVVRREVCCGSGPAPAPAPAPAAA